MFIALLSLLQSCGINSNVMFKVPKGDINYDSIPLYPTEDYHISIDDKISFTLTTNKGATIIDNYSGVDQTSTSNESDYEYVVRKNGDVKLPIVGFVHIDGLTIQECEDTLINLFKSSYQEPFVQVKITNQRVIVFPGNGSDAKVIPLMNANTTLMEALAQAGGITDRGKANTIKLMRNEDGVRKVYGIDLSTIEGLKYVDMIVQANDYIYVEPTADIAKELADDVIPIVTLFTSVLLIFTVISTFK